MAGVRRDNSYLSGTNTNIPNTKLAKSQDLEVGNVLRGTDFPGNILDKLGKKEVWW